MFTNDYFEERERWERQTYENSARRAWAYGTCTSTGWGEFLIPDPLMFGVTFTEMPIVSYGFSLEDDEQLDKPDDGTSDPQDRAGRYPRPSGGVARWVQDGNDFYIGAHVFITVATADPIQTAYAALQDAMLIADGSTNLETGYGEDPGYGLIHHFTFNGLAIKDMTP